MKKNLKNGITVFYYCENCGDEEKSIHLGFGSFDLPELLSETKCAECNNLAKMYFFFKSCKYMYCLTTPQYELRESKWRKVRGTSKFSLPSGQVTSFRIFVYETKKFAVIITQDGSSTDDFETLKVCDENSSAMLTTLEKFGYQCEVLSGSSSHDQLTTFIGDVVEKWKSQPLPMKVFFYFSGHGFRTPEGFIVMRTSDGRKYRLQDFVYLWNSKFDMNSEEEESEGENERLRKDSEFFFLLDIFSGGRRSTKSSTNNSNNNMLSHHGYYDDDDDEQRPGRNFRFTRRGSSINLRQFILRMYSSKKSTSYYLRNNQNQKKEGDEEEEEEEFGSVDFGENKNSRFLEDVKCSLFTHSFIKAVEERKGGDFEDILRVQGDYMEGISKILSLKKDDRQLVSIDSEKVKKMNL